VLDRTVYQYQASTSDIAGQDIRIHGNDPSKAIPAVRDWLSQFVPKGTLLPGGQKMAKRYETFCSELPAIIRKLGITRRELIYNDYTTIVTNWLLENA
jgi:hypothetical protein